MEENKVATREKLLSILNLHYSHEGAADAILQSPDLRVTLELARYDIFPADDGVKVMDRLTGAYVAWFRDGYVDGARTYADSLNSKEPK